jgi:drug/metabolite transporter (DMT)-like permease
MISMPALSENTRGALYMMLSMAGFSLNDMLIKTLAGELSVFQTVFLRGLVATALIGLLAARRGELTHRIAPEDRKLVALRTCGEIGGTICFLTALFHMPIANATAILQAIPLAVALGATLFLGETVGWHRYLAIAVGFGGVVLIVRPGAEGFNAYALWAVAAVCFMSVRDLATRRLSQRIPSLFVTFITAAAITLTGAVVTAFLPWQPVTVTTVALLSGAAGFLLVGYFFSVATMRHGEIGFVVPFRYTVLIWAILIGIIVFDEIPDALTLAGSALVVGTGVYTFYRERRLRRAAARRPSARA